MILVTHPLGPAAHAHAHASASSTASSSSAAAYAAAAAAAAAACRGCRLREVVGVAVGVADGGAAPAAQRREEFLGHVTAVE